MEVATDPGVVRAIEAAVEADPGNAALRIHPGGQLLGVGRTSESLDQAEAVLHGESDQLEARSAGAVQGLSLMIMFPLAFLSNASVPVSTLRDGCRRSPGSIPSPMSSRHCVT